MQTSEFITATKKRVKSICISVFMSANNPCLIISIRFILRPNNPNAAKAGASAITELVKRQAKYRQKHHYEQPGKSENNPFFIKSRHYDFRQSKPVDTKQFVSKPYFF